MSLSNLFPPNAISDFHFLRPEWAWAILPVVILIMLNWKQSKKTASWVGIIRPEFMNVLLEMTGKKTKHWPRLLAYFSVFSLLIIALMGPTWDKTPTLSVENKKTLAVLLDLSLSMYANDHAPSRIKRAQFKLQDILDKSITGLTSLTVYAGSAHSVVPMSNDIKTLKLLIPQLEPSIMPKYGSQPSEGIETAIRGIDQENTKSATLLWITDGIKNSDIKPISKIIKRAKTNFKVIIYLIGTKNGSPVEVPNGQLLRDRKNNIVIAKLDTEPFQTLRRALEKQGQKTEIIRFSKNDTDIKTIQAIIDQAATPGNDQGSSDQVSDARFDQWVDRGPWVALILILIFILSCRKGVLLSLPFPLLLHIGLLTSAGLPSSSSADSSGGTTSDASSASSSPWLNNNQEGYRLFESNEFEAATERFEHPNWKAASTFKAGRHQEAAQLYEDMGDTPSAHYNRGNSLAHAGNLPGAIQAYEDALALDPNHAAAKQNKALVEQWLKQAQNQPNQDNQQNQDQNQDSQNQDSQESQQGQENQQGNQQNSQNSNNSQGESGEQEQASGAQNDDQNGQESDQASASGTDAETGEEGNEGEEQESQGAEAAESQPSSPEEAAAAEAMQQQLAEQENEADEGGEEDASATQRTQPAAQPPMKDPLPGEVSRWLQNIDDDPGQLLKNKFKYEASQNRKQGNGHDEEYW